MKISFIIISRNVICPDNRFYARAYVLVKHAYSNIEHLYLCDNYQV